MVTAAPRFPGQLPEVWRVPHLRNPGFVGREATLGWITDTLAGGGRVALHGLGGVGKTQIAVEYLYRSINDRDVVWWVRAEDPVTLVDDLAALGPAVGLPAGDTPVDTALGVIEVLRRRSGWLLVFDNAVEPEELRGWLPAGNSGRVVVTTRNPGFQGLASTMAVQVMDLDEATRFITARVPGGVDPQQVEELAEELGRLPLAMEQATAYITATGRTVEDYRALLATNRAGLLARGDLSTDYPDTVATTWELAFKEVANTSSEAAELLNVVAYLAPEGIPRALFTTSEDGELPDRLSEAIADPLRFDDLVVALRRYSLLDVKADTLAVHRLVQAVTRDRIDPHRGAVFIGAAVHLVANAFPFDPADPSTWVPCALMLPHATAVLGHADAIDVTTPSVSQLHTDVGRYLRTVAQFTQARHHSERALAINETVLGPDHRYVAANLNDLALVLRDLGESAEARPLLERALTIDETVYGPDHPEVATRLNNLAMLLRDLGKAAEAQPLLERALTIDETVYGPDHPYVAANLSNLAVVLRDLGESAEARPLLERALTIDETVYGPDHPNVATDLTTLALVVGDLGESAEARPLLERALTIAETVYGPDHPEVATDLSNLALVVGDLGESAEARPLLERALTIDETVYGPDHPEVATDLSNLALVLWDLGESAEARPLLERALTIAETVYGPDHPTVATHLSNLAMVLRDQGESAAARPLLERALTIDETVHGPDHPTVATHLSNLAMVLRDQGESAEARPLLERALIIDETVYGPDHPVTQTIRDLI